MTRKDYVMIAACIKATMDDNDDTEAPLDNAVRQHVANLASALARDFATDNPLFDRPRFLTACGLQTESIPSIFQPGALANTPMNRSLR